MASWAVVSLSCHSPIIVRGFCFVKYESVGLTWLWIPAFAGMTWEGAGYDVGVWVGMTQSQIAGCGLQTADCRLMIGDCKMAPWVVVSLSCHSPIIVRGFCFVKYESVGLTWLWIPAFGDL